MIIVRLSEQSVDIIENLILERLAILHKILRSASTEDSTLLINEVKALTTSFTSLRKGNVVQQVSSRSLENVTPLQHT